MAELKVQKFVSSLPGTLERNTIYFVKIATGFDIYVTNDVGTILAYPLNHPSSISGSIASSQVAVGNGTNSIIGDNNFKWNGAQLEIRGPNNNPGFKIFNGANGFYFYNGAGAPGNFAIFDITYSKDRFIITPTGIRFGDEAYLAATFLHNFSTGFTKFGNNATPTEVIDAVGNIKYTDGLKPNGTGGTANQILSRNSANTADIWIDQPGINIDGGDPAGIYGSPNNFDGGTII